jgi:hypothetical protein
MREDELSPVLVRCPICNADDIGAAAGAAIQTKCKSTAVWRCAAGFASRMPDGDALKEYYASYYDVPKYRDLGESYVHFPCRNGWPDTFCAE